MKQKQVPMQFMMMRVVADTYGYLYNWYAVDDDRGICPEEWYVPTDDEVKELEMYLGMNEEEASGTGWRGTNEGSKLVGETDLWPDGNLINNLGYDEKSGFDFFPSGYRYYNNGNFDHIGISGYLFTVTQVSAGVLKTIRETGFLFIV